MIKILEILAFTVSAAAFGYGAFHLLRSEVPKLFQFYAYAAGCYMLEELWVIVNSLLGNGGEDGLMTVRLIGFFGCLCFMLTANAHSFDKTVDEGQSKKPRRTALIAPLVLLLLYALFVFSPANTSLVSENVLGLVAVSPALFAAYFNLKHLLLPVDAMGFLRVTRGIDILALIFYAANFIYPLLYLYCPAKVMGLFDIVLAVIFFGMMILCGKGVVRWKTLI